MTKTALYAGSFDPLTNGHLDIIRRASALFDQVIVAPMTNVSKAPLFTSEEKVALINTAVQALANVTVVAAPRQLTVAFAQTLGAQYLVRGLRNTADFNYEADIAAMNASLAADLESVFLMAAPRYRFVSSSLIREVASFGGDVTALVPANVATALTAKFEAPHA
ncbi:pantetheine-phosphate adenylyltransferase [Lacticaseibacillus nasuensis]|uniref:Phosphopantetheine adenylyltransferase n=1 Tax=Lacticaseibacillus nasuensis JCM 17158 TaxID=1291734 RepID=A0A0R1K1C8_9LACO|nr:pantetheine-phosphate adenylyltransferase [Lacticaseibacillus nasuensis]KRK74417.1 phosphopantetheine adenylyltransferase [Lacticaseibacillus nasuensis JCM 17158]